jgi:uncharacterized protein YukE
MNVEAVQDIANGLKTQAGALRVVLGRVDSLVGTNQGEWAGSDAQAFVGWWQGQHRPLLVNLIERLEGLGQSAANNATEQVRASGGADSGTSAGSSDKGTSPAPVVDPGPSTSPADASQATREAAANSFLQQWKGQTLDTDGNGAWCFDVFRKYSTDYVHAPISIASGNYSDKASDIYLQYGANETQNYYDRIPFGTEPPQAGDIIVYGAVSPWDPTYGHVGLVVQGGESFKTLEQHVSGATVVQEFDRSTASTEGILGYLRPRV